jgi:predicted butyrate kinase (DUF1464 family)
MISFSNGKLLDGLGGVGFCSGLGGSSDGELSSCCGCFSNFFFSFHSWAKRMDSFSQV